MRLAPLAAIVVFLAPPEAQAIPRFAVRSGATCATCHVNPSGGGMRNRYGRNVFAATRLPLRGGENGPGALVDADLSETLAVGADLRSGYLYSRPKSDLGRANTLYLMQADAYVGAVASEWLSFYLDLGFYGSGEAWALAELPGPLYVKAGRFVPSYGLRLENHSAFVREGLGFGPRIKDAGVEVGLRRGGLHVQAAVMNGARDDKFFDDNWQKALLGRVEWVRRGETLRVMAGAHGFYNITGAAERGSDTREGDVRSGAFLGASLGRLAYLAEADVKMTRRFNEYRWTRSYASYQELGLLVARGVEINLNYEYQDPNLRYSQNALSRWLVGLEVFASPNLEMKAFYRRASGHIKNPLSGLQEFLVMAHVFL